MLSRVWLFVTPWTIAYQAPLTMGFSRQEYWRGLPFSSPGDLPNPGIEPGSPALQTDALPSEPPGNYYYTYQIADPAVGCLCALCTFISVFLSIIIIFFIALRWDDVRQQRKEAIDPVGGFLHSILYKF